MRTVVLVSGGLDSAVLLAQVTRDHDVVCALSFAYGSKHNAKELPCAESQCQLLGVEHKVLNLEFISECFRSSLLLSGDAIPDGHYEEQSMQKTVVPFRNGIMLSVAAGLAESLGGNAVAIAAHAGDHAIYPDCRNEFMESMAAAMTLGTYAGVELLRPFIALSKTDIVRRGSELGVDFANTWSCYKGGSRHCGSCGTCVERREAFINASLPDPTPYLATGELPMRPGPGEA